MVRRVTRLWNFHVGVIVHEHTKFGCDRTVTFPENCYRENRRNKKKKIKIVPDGFVCDLQLPDSVTFM